MLSLQAFSSGVADASKTLATVWSSNTIEEAWRHLDAFLISSTGDPQHRQLAVDNDLVALSSCTSEAEVEHLMMIIPPKLRQQILMHPRFLSSAVEEIFLHVGQHVEVRGYGWVFSVDTPTVEDLQFVLKRVGRFSDDGRGNIASTLHRASCWTGKRGEVLGLTLRVGRFAPNCAATLLPLAEKGNLLLVSKPGAGKTTMLRDIAASLARHPEKPRVVVVDTSNEIGGDGIIPLPFLGRTRRFQVPRRSDQLRVMLEVLQNHSPEYLIVDEIGTQAEAEAAWSISQRGVKLVATCHGECLAQLLQNKELNLLVGGATQAFLSNEERRLRNKIRKTVLERPHASPFEFVAELSNRNSAFVYHNVNKAVDLILNDENAKSHADICGEVDLSRPIPSSFLAPEAAAAAATTSDANRQSVDVDGYGSDLRTASSANSGGDFYRHPRRHERHRHHHHVSKRDLYKEIDQLL